MTDKERIEFLAGEVNALRAFCLAVVNTHPEPATLGDQFHRLSEMAIGISGGSAVSEEYMKGMQQTAEEFTKHILSKIE